MFAPHLIMCVNKKGKHKEKKTNESYKIKKKLFKTSSKMEWDFNHKGNADGNTSKSFFNV